MKAKLQFEITSVGITSNFDRSLQRTACGTCGPSSGEILCLSHLIDINMPGAK